MRSFRFAFMMLSLFTTRQRASAIEGDLIEEGEHRGSIWFVVHVIGTTLALLLESLRQAPLRIGTLTMAGIGLSWMACSIATTAFFAPDAFVPVPLVGFVAIFLWAFLIGFGLEYLAPGLGVRAAALAIMVLTLLFIATVAPTLSDSFVDDFRIGLGLGMLKAFGSLVRMLGSVAFGIFIFLGPLMVGSVYAHHRSANA